MSLHPEVLKELKHQLVLVLALTSSEIQDAAGRVAYFSAMIDAADDDPFEDEEDQAEILAILHNELNTALSDYMSLVNDAM